MSSQNCTPSFSVAADVESALKAAAEGAGLDAAAFEPDVRPAEPRHGDYQANGVLAWARKLRVPPRDLAGRIAAGLPEPSRSAWDVAVAGPGFINVSLKPAALAAWLAAYPDREAQSAGASRSGPAARRAGQTWVVDYCGPNTAKEMHVGHLRSAVIGEALCRLLAFTGARVVRDNHVGDWGTQFGKLIWAYKRGRDAAALARDPLAEFERLYKAGNAAAEVDPAAMEEARAELVKLQGGDPENVSIWRDINAASLGAFRPVYGRLGIRFDLSLGESFYNDRVAAVYRELLEAGLAVESEGALVVFHPEHPRFHTQPFIVRKSDGAANYASTDLATVLYRAEELRAAGVLYVVDSRQRDHFEQLFLTVAKWFAATGRRAPELRLVDFGMVLGENGKPLKTRSGENVKLRELLDEAEERAYRLVSAKSPEFPEADRRAIASVVGVGSVQYADLAQSRTSDYVFSWEKMISLEGNTAAYLLYAVARIHSIFRRENLAPGPAAEAGAGPLETPGELALARKLVEFADALELAAAQLAPHFLCLYLYELAGEFSAFYNADKVLVGDPPVRARRLLLCARTLATLETGLHLLGLRTLTRM